MAVFGKRNESASEDVADYLRIPLGTRFATSADGKLVLSFAGDMSFGESLPEIGELVCGRNLSLDPGVTMYADNVKVKAALELGSGARLICRSIQAGSISSDKAAIEAQEIQASNAEFKESSVTAARLTARENVYADRGELEIGTVTAQNLTLRPGTRSNIQVAEIAGKTDGQVSEGGYESYKLFLAKLYIYHPELLSEQAQAEASQIVEQGKDRLKAVHKLVRGDKASPGEQQLSELTPDIVSEPSAEAPTTAPAAESADKPSDALNDRLEVQAAKLRSFYDKRETPAEVSSLLELLKQGDLPELRRQLNPTYQKLAAQGKIPDPVMEAFLELQRMLKEDSRGRRESPVS